MGDARGWDSDEFRASVMAERSLRTRIVFSVKFAPSTGSTAPQLVATATSDGHVGLHSLLQSHSVTKLAEECPNSLAKPLLTLLRHDGPAYDLLSFGEQESEMLSSCGDDGRIAIWRWKDILNTLDNRGDFDGNMQPVIEFKNPQQRGPHGALLPVSETNALAVDSEAGQLFSAAGDGCAYAWDLETGQAVLVFKGHSDYLQCVASRPSHKQIVTGSEDGTARIWDCRSGRCTAILDPWNAVRVLRKPQGKLPWVSCISVDATENWMISGSGGRCVTLWNLPMVASATRIATLGTPQALTFTKDQIVVVGAQPHVSRFSFGGQILSQAACAPLSSFSVTVHPSGVTAVGGHAGMVDILSDFGSHLCTFCC